MSAVSTGVRCVLAEGFGAVMDHRIFLSRSVAIKKPLLGFLPRDERLATLSHRLAALVEHCAMPRRRWHVSLMTR